MKRLLEQYDALILFFTDAAFEDKLLASDMILHRLKEKYVKLYLQFLEFVLQYLTNLNLEMQSEETKIHRLYSQVSLVYNTLLDCFLKTEYLKSTVLEKVEFENPHNFVPLDDIYHGPKVAVALSEKSGGLTALDLKDFRTRCLQFYIETCSQIINRFNLRSESSKIFKDLSILDPSQMSKFKSVVPIATKFPNLVSENDFNTLDAEWRELRNIEVDIDSEKPSIEYWNSVSKM